jgi:hypothetical protein
LRELMPRLRQIGMVPARALVAEPPAAEMPELDAPE